MDSLRRAGTAWSKQTFIRLKDSHAGCSSRGASTMCDYSLHAVTSRPAKVGDHLRTTQFRNSMTGGLATVCEPDVAVCLLPGTEVAFDREPRFASSLGLLWSIARFRQVNTRNPNMHHDALEFPSGKIVMITRLVENQTLTVLQLPVEKHKPVVASQAVTVQS
jgi:hypothetical protein